MKKIATRDLLDIPVLKSISSTRVENFMEAAVVIGGDFLACGGPVTRLEAQLSAAGQKSGFETTIRATPSAITVYCHARDNYESHSRASRMLSFGVDLGRLSLIDRVLNQFARGEIDSIEALKYLKRIRQRVRAPSYFLRLLSIFGIGVGAGFLSGAGLADGLVCGVFSMFVQMVVALVRRFFTMSPMFSEFLACFLAFFLAIFAKLFLTTPPELLVVGTLIYVVPGLLMTTAISEIVDQNYLSGTIRLLKALCTFMAMGLAYFLAVDLGHMILHNQNSISYLSALKPTLLLRILGSILIISCSVGFRAHFAIFPLNPQET